MTKKNILKSKLVFYRCWFGGRNHQKFGARSFGDKWSHFQMLRSRKRLDSRWTLVEMKKCYFLFCLFSFKFAFRGFVFFFANLKPKNLGKAKKQCSHFWLRSAVSKVMNNTYFKSSHKILKKTTHFFTLVHRNPRHTLYK
jgi:hypothetical protein